jgi:hypothetical protein
MGIEACICFTGCFNRAQILSLMRMHCRQTENVMESRDTTCNDM